MNSQIIIYGSEYGSTKRYAERLSEITGIEAINYKEVKDIGDFKRVIYLGGLFAGGVMGLKKTVSKMTPQQELVLATVGMTNPNETTYFEGIRKALKAQLPSSFYDENKIFHLRGAIDYGQLSFKHRIMMKMFHSMMLKKPESELTADAKAMLETYGKQVDFVDYDGLKPIIEIVEKTKLGKMESNTDYLNTIEKLQLEPHPEGGYYRQLYGNDATGKKDISTIYYMLTGSDISAFHRLHSVTEIWYYHAGEPLHLYVIDAEGYLTVHQLSPKGEMQVVIHPEEWFAAEIPSKKGFCLVGCAVAPAFSFENFELGHKDALLQQYPQYAEVIDRLT